MKNRGIPLPAFGISDPGNNDAISVFPNPASDQVSVRVAATLLPANLELLSLDIYNHKLTGAGRQVNTGKLWIE